MNSSYHKEQPVLVAVTKIKTMLFILILCNLLILWLKGIDILSVLQLECSLDHLIPSLLQDEDIKELINSFKVLSIHHETMEIDEPFESLETTTQANRKATKKYESIAATNPIPDWKKRTKIKVVVTVE